MWRRPKRQEDEAFELIDSLQLPHDDTSLRIVAVADLDLSSAAALAEYALTDVNISGGKADFLVACGPFCRDEDLKPYMSRRGSQLERTPELTAALEGLMTGALSQLESIVCRVCFCPAGPHDPETTLISRGDEGPLRLTPNSRNILDEWMSLAPALGCGGLSVNADESFTEYRSVKGTLHLTFDSRAESSYTMSQNSQTLHPCLLFLYLTTSTAYPQTVLSCRNKCNNWSI